MITAGKDLFSGIIQGSGGPTVSGGIQTMSGANSYSVAASAVLDLDGFDQFLPELTHTGIVRFGVTPGTMLTVWVSTVIMAQPMIAAGFFMCCTA